MNPPMKANIVAANDRSHDNSVEWGGETNGKWIESHRKNLSSMSIGVGVRRGETLKNQKKLHTHAGVE